MRQAKEEVRAAPADDAERARGDGCQTWSRQLCSGS